MNDQNPIHSGVCSCLATSFDSSDGVTLDAVFRVCVCVYERDAWG